MKYTIHIKTEQKLHSVVIYAQMMYGSGGGNDRNYGSDDNEMNSVATEIEVLVVNGDGFRSSFLSGG